MEGLESAYPTLQILREDGTVDKEREPQLRDTDLRTMYRSMLLTRLIDERCMLLQRQGRLAFFGASTGEEAAVVGSASALRDDDWIFPALRQGGALLMRGFPLERYFAHMMGTASATEKGRSMPMHFSDRRQNVVTWSSSMATQLPHAVGMAYGVKRRGEDKVAMGYLGDGATSESDFHVAMNFAGVWKVPAVFFCHNNQWAISVPFHKQTASETVAQKAVAYGFDGVRVDGNDVLACYAAARDAVENARRGEGPTLIEAVTYRMLGHSSSDDPSRYRDEAEVDAWAKKDPLVRFRRYLTERGAWSDDEDRETREALNEKILTAVRFAEQDAQPEDRTLVEDVYADVPWHLERQFEAWVRDR